MRSRESGKARLGEWEKMRRREISFIIIVREEIVQEKHEIPPKQG